VIVTCNIFLRIKCKNIYLKYKNQNILFFYYGVLNKISTFELILERHIIIIKNKKHNFLPYPAIEYDCIPYFIYYLNKKNNRKN
jgi:hypothetical protein